MKVKPINFIPNKFTLLTIMLCAFSAFGQSDYYWVGGTGNWSNYSSHWATSSGGNIFHTTTPSSNDNVIFDSNSFSANNQTVTLNADNESVGNMTWLGVTNTPTFNMSSKQLMVHGSITYDPIMTINSPGTLTFTSTNTSFLISGGHSQFLSVNGLGNYRRLGTTIDDALGEAFDKTAKLLGIEFPGGPKLEKFAEKGDPNKFKLPKPIINKGGCNLSFAGLKTAILRITKNINSEQEKYDLAASFQKTIEEILYIKSKIAFKEFSKNKVLEERNFIVAGGVAANNGIRKKLIQVSYENNFKPIFPDFELCGDNAAMIALVGLEKFKQNKFNNLDLSASPRLPLDSSAKFLKGPGIKL